MAKVRSHAGKHGIYIVDGLANLRELENTDLSGAHLHFNGPFDLRDLVSVDLRNTTLIINDYQGIPPCSGCGKAFGDGQAQLLDCSAVLPPTPASQISTNETDPAESPPRKRLRKPEPSEDGELGPSSPATKPTAMPLASELHPDRVAMLRDPSPEIEEQPVKFISRTKANCLEMPFNRLEQRQFQRALTNFSTSTDISHASWGNMHSARGAVHKSMSDDEGRNSAGHDEERVGGFLRTLEPDVPVRSQQSEHFGRLSPVPAVDSEMLETPPPSASPARLQLEGELETYVLRKHSGAELEVVVKRETAM